MAVVEAGSDTTAIVTALTALVVAVGGVITAAAGFVKMLRELRQNTKLTTMGVVTGESTHSLLTEETAKNETVGP